jgi:hypothetical protein
VEHKYLRTILQCAEKMNVPVFLAWNRVAYMLLFNFKRKCVYKTASFDSCSNFCDEYGNAVKPAIVQYCEKDMGVCGQE